MQQMVDQRKIKILECIRQGQIGGGESHLLSLVENLGRDRFDPVVLSFTEGPMVDQLRKMNVPVYVIHTKTAFDVTVWGKVKSLLKQEKIDLVHAHGSRANSNINTVARQLKIPVIYTIHGWSFHDDQPTWKKKLRTLGEKWLTRNSNTNISVSASNQASGKKQISSFDSIVVNNGINEHKFDPKCHDGIELRKELNYSESDVVVIFMARFTQHKQPMVLLEAFFEAIKKAPQLKLLMVGDGDQKASAMQRVELAGMEDYVRFLPFRQDVPELLSIADIYVLPSLWEGLPIGLLEAMSMEKAIIASAVDGTIEIIKNEETGILISVEKLQSELADKIIQLAQNESQRKALGKAARLTVKNNFNAGKMTRAIENIYTMQLSPKKN